MPMYLYYCMRCGSEREDIRCVADRLRGPRCDRCEYGQRMTLQITPVHGIVKNPAVPKEKRK